MRMEMFLMGVVAFLMGSIPFGLIISKSQGLDIREHGSGNIGATNVFRVMGKGWGTLAFVLDFLKGFLPVVIAINLFGITDKGTVITLSFLHDILPDVPRDEAFWTQFLQVACALLAILGHNYCPWIGFNGGKGIATSAGVLVALMPFGFLLVFVVWLITFLTSKYVSLASILASAALPVVTHIGARIHHVIDEDKTSPTLWEAGLWNKPLFFFSLIIGILAVWRHKSNIVKLLNGTENRFGKK